VENKFVPVDVTDLDIAFGGRAMELLPDVKDIPEEYWDDNNKWCRLINRLFYGPVEGVEIASREGIDVHKAGRHIMAILRSFAPEHEHKIAGCAYLASMFFEDVTFDS
jgi:hypothetical protein